MYFAYSLPSFYRVDLVGHAFSVDLQSTTVCQWLILPKKKPLTLSHQIRSGHIMAKKQEGCKVQHDASHSVHALVPIVDANVL